MAADEAKARGNAAFSAGRFEEAAAHFGDAIALAPDNHVLFSNRSAAYASLGRYKEALADADRTVALRPDWAKGYSRLGAARLGLGDAAGAVEAYEKGLALEPSNAALRDGLAQARSALPRRPASGADAIGNIFQGPDLWSKIAADPTTRAYLDQPDFMKMLRDLQRNPGNLNNYLSDPRMMQVLSLMLNVKVQNQNNDASEPKSRAPAPGPSKSSPPPPQQQQKQPEAKPREPEPEPVEMTDEEKERKERKAAAQKEKEAGNAAYKKKDFETAIQHYTKAMELDDEDISYLTNRAAVYLEMGQYDDCIKSFFLSYPIQGARRHQDPDRLPRSPGKKGAAGIERPGQTQVAGARPLRQAAGHEHASLYADSVPSPVQDTDEEDQDVRGEPGPSAPALVESGTRDSEDGGSVEYQPAVQGAN